jgi:hypothetical protein
MIVSLFLAGYEYELVDATGKYPKQVPIPDVNDLQRVSTSHIIRVYNESDLNSGEPHGRAMLFTIQEGCRLKA